MQKKKGDKNIITYLCVMKCIKIEVKNKGMGIEERTTKKLQNALTAPFEK